VLARWRRFTRAQKAAASLAGAAAAAAVVWLVNWGMPQLVDWIQGVQAPPEAARLFIVDTSSSMTGSLGKKTKFKSALGEVRTITRLESDDVAYAVRTTGGGCARDASWHEPLVPFQAGNAALVPAKLKTVRVGGAGDVVTAIRRAKNDFRHYGAAKSAMSKTIWLFLGTTKDDCDPAHLPLGAAIKDALTDASADLSSVDFFVLRGEKKRVLNFQKAIEGLGSNFKVIPVRTHKQLSTAVINTARRETVSH